MVPVFNNWGELNEEFHSFKTYFIFAPIILIEFLLYNFSVKVADSRVIYQEVSKQRAIDKKFAWLKGGWNLNEHRGSIDKFVQKMQRKAENNEKID